VRCLTASLVLVAAALPASRAFAQDGGHRYDDRPDVVPPMAGGEDGDDGRPRKHRQRRAPDIDEVRAPTLLSGQDGFPLAGYHAGKFYLRDEDDNFRLYPGALLQVDARAFAGRGVDDLSGPAGDSTKANVSIHRARLELGGEAAHLFGFYLTGDLAHQQLDHALIDVGIHKWLHISVGQQQVPFTMDNRTNDAFRAWMDRPLAVRFGQPSEYDLGVMAWGESKHATISYEAGIFGGDGQNRPSPDNRFDYVGRLVFRPLASAGGLAQNIHIGASGFWGMRRSEDVLYDAPSLTTEGGYAFFTPSYIDSNLRSVHVLPSGVQRGFAGEVRVPVSQLDLRVELVETHREMREALDGFQATNTERYGTMRGNAVSAQLGVFVLGSPAIRPEPGRFKPPHIEFPRGTPHKVPHGLEIFVRGEALHMTYSATDRASAPGDTTPDRTVQADVLGAGVNYYASRHAMVAFNYAYYMFPSSGTSDNAALAPGNVACVPTSPAFVNQTCHSGAHSLHELGLRLQMFF
jgi:hypothetical protein